MGAIRGPLAGAASVGGLEALLAERETFGIGAMEPGADALAAVGEAPGLGEAVTDAGAPDPIPD